MQKTIIITAAALSGISIAVSLYLSRQKQYLASSVRHYSTRGQLSPSTPHNISSLPAEVFNSKCYAVYDYASIAIPRRALPDLELRQLLTVLLRRNMAFFAYLPQARLLKLMASDPEARQSFDPAHIETLEFREGDLVCNAYRVKLRTDEKVEFEFQLAIQGRLAMSVEVEEGVAVFHNETLMIREKDSKTKLPLENGLANWLHELTAWWMLESGVNYLRELKGKIYTA